MMPTIKQVVLDCDGVLTNGKQYIDPDGEKLFKAFHSRDIKALRWLVAQGLDVVVISADDWDGAPTWCERVGIRFIHARDKLQAIKDEGFAPDETIMVGDDAWDVQALNYVDYPFCPYDAEPVVRKLDGMVRLAVPAGRGVVAGLVRYLQSWEWFIQ